MEITEVRIFPVESRDGKLKAFATMTFDDWFVVRNVKVIQGNNGLFVAMPSRKAIDPCPKCRFKNARGSRYCNQCGAEIGQPTGGADNAERRKPVEHMDIAHPVKQECRMYIQEKVLAAYNNEADRQKKEGAAYKPRTEEDLDEISKGLPSPEGKAAAPAKKAEASSEEEAKDIEL